MKKALVGLGLMGGLVSPLPAGSFDLGAHTAMSERAVVSSGLDGYLRKHLAFPQGTEAEVSNGTNNSSIAEWIQRGARSEDSPSVRVRHHFHNPTRPWDQAGLRVAGVQIGESSVLWGQDRRQTIGGKHSWHDARASFFQALTATTDSVRQKAYTETFQSLGQLIHLIQDAASPAHTRNDAHLCCLLGVGDRDEFHVWAEVPDNRNQALSLPSQRFDTSILTLPSNPLAPLPIAHVLDTERYRQTGVPEAGLDIGLAEYSSANFFSDDTVFSDLPFPAASSVVLGEPEFEPLTQEQRRYFKKVGDGELIDHLAVPSALYEFLPEALKGRKKGLDNKVLQDYAVKLFPRAVGYSAGLIDYFFRNDIEISLPLGGVYAVTTDTDPLTGAFRTLRLNARSLLTSGEAMSNGTIQLVVSYRTSQGDPFQGQIVTTSDEVSHVVVPVANNVRSIPSDQPVELVFNLTDAAIPLLATDLRIQLVYKGDVTTAGGMTMADTVVVGYYDPSEPTPIILVNNMDHICVGGSYAVAGSAEAIAAVDSNHNGLADEQDVFAHGIQNLYVRLAAVNLPQPASSAATGHHVAIATINPAQFGQFFVLTDYQFSLSLAWSAARMDDLDTHGHLTLPHDAASVPAVKNQFGVVNGAEAREVSLLVPVRGIYAWQYVPFENRPVQGDFCAAAVVVAAQPTLTGPVEATAP